MLLMYRNSLANLILIAVISIIISAIFVRYQYIFIPPTASTDGEFDNLLFLLIREACWIFLAGVSLIIILKNKIKSFIFISLVLLVLLLFLRNVLNNNFETFLYGVRVILVFLSFPAVSYMCENLDLERIKKIMEKFLKIIIIILFPIAIYQLKFFPPTFGSTFLGSRVNGFYYNPIAFSMFLASISLILFAIKANNYKFWIFFCIILTIFTGGRTGILVSLSLLFLSYFSYLTKNKISLLIVFFTLLPLIFLLVSNPIISGRAATAENGFKDGRFDTWEYWMDRILPDASNFLFGISIGSGTNAAVRFSAGRVADSMYVTFLSSFGLIGLIILLLFITYYFLKLSNKAFIALLVALAFSAAQNLPEVNPLNIMVIFAIIYAHHSEKKIYRSFC